MPLARLQLREANSWWAANREHAPGALAVAVRRALDRIGASPRIGRLASEIPRDGVRCYYVQRVRYFIYYRIIGETIEVLSFWHASRGSPPPI